MLKTRSIKNEKLDGLNFKMNNSDILSYLKKFDKFGTAKLQRHYYWGYERAINKIIELVDSGLIYEVPGEPFVFRICTENGNYPKESFAAILKSREILPPKSHKTRIWFESINLKENNQLTLNAEKILIKNLIKANVESKLYIVNSDRRLRLNLAGEKNSISFKSSHSIGHSSLVVLFLVKSKKDSANIKLLLKNSAVNGIEKLYIIGDSLMLQHIKRSLTKN